MMFGKIIKCVGPDGHRADYVAVPIVGDGFVWVELHDDAEDAQTVREPAVRNSMKMCDPDVELIEEKDSLFEKTPTEEEVAA